MVNQRFSFSRNDTEQPLELKSAARTRSAVPISIAAVAHDELRKSFELCRRPAVILPDSAA